MTTPYYKWVALTEENQNEHIAAGDLPYVPIYELRGCLLMSRMIIVDGERCWEIERARNNAEREIFSEVKQITVRNITMRCKFNPIYGDYKARLNGKSSDKKATISIRRTV